MTILRTLLQRLRPPTLPPPGKARPPSKLRLVRLAHGYTLRELAALTGLSLRQLRLYEIGRNMPSYPNAQRVAAALDLSVEEFYEFIEEARVTGETPS